jgi:hypothetical protein
MQTFTHVTINILISSRLTHQQRHFLRDRHFTARGAPRSCLSSKRKVNLSVANYDNDETEAVDGQHGDEISHIKWILSFHWQANAVEAEN